MGVAPDGLVAAAERAVRTGLRGSGGRLPRPREHAGGNVPDASETENPWPAGSAGGRPRDPWDRVRRVGAGGYAVVVAAFAVYAASLLLRSPGTYIETLDVDVNLFVEFGAALLCLVGALRRGAHHRSGLHLAAGLLLWSVGDLLFSTASPEGPAGVSLADPLFLIFYPLAYAGIIVSLRADARVRSSVSLADGLITALGCATVVAVMGLDEALDPGDGPLLTRLVTIAYPIADLILLSAVAGVFGALPHGRLRGQLPWLLMLGGGALFTISDTVYLVISTHGDYRQGDLVDAGWPAAMLLISVSVWARPPRQLGEPGRGREHMLLPAAAAGIGFLVLVWSAVVPIDRVDVVLATATLVTAAARTAVLLRELDGLEAERKLRRQAEEAGRLLAVQEAENRTLAGRLSRLVDAAPVGIVEVDEAGRVRRWNRAAERIYGWTEQEVRGGPDPNPERPGRPGDAVCHRRKDGSTVEVEIAEASLGGRDQPDGVLRVVSDVSERVHLELQLRHAQRLETVGRLAEGVAHELNTPIQYVGDALRFLESTMDGMRRLEEVARVPGRADPGGHLDRLRAVMEEIDLAFLAEEGTEAAANGLEGVRRMSEIVRAMGVFGRPGETLRRAVDLNEAVRAVLIMVGPRIAPVADVITDLTEVPLVVCQPGDVNQVLFDVVANAVDAMAAVVRQRGRGTLRVATRADGDAVVIEIEDTGCGIPEPIAGQVFDPFFTTKPVGLGIGQGLSVSRSLIVDRHGGAITFSSEVGRGTTFRIRLPLGE